MSYRRFIKNLGFDDDPFAKTNADEEQRLEKYFIAPSFFSAVYGDIKTPKSNLVFAPRGNGKTALKRKIEISSLEKDFLCITYNLFDVSNKTIKDINQEYHLKNIIRLIVISVITAINEKSKITLPKDDRHYIYLFAKKYLSDIETSELKIAISAIKNFSDKAKDVWNNFTGPIGLILNALLQKINIGLTDINKFDVKGGKLGNYIDQLKILRIIAKKLNFKSIYILFDRIDETAITNGSKDSYAFVASIINDLQLLELEGYGFKFFLWDLLLEEYRNVARPDRIKYFTLHWEAPQIKEMLSQRLKAFSNNKIISFSQLLDKDNENFDIDIFISHFSQGSPRTAIRICKEIIDQQSEIDTNSKKISDEAVKLGFNVIAKNISHEIYNESLIKDLKKTKKCEFTVRHISTNVFKFSQQAGISKVKLWTDVGAIKQLGTIQETRGARNSKLYGIVDLLLAKTIFPNMSIYEFTREKLLICTCGNILIRDWEIAVTCDSCQEEVKHPHH